VIDKENGKTFVQPGQNFTLSEAAETKLRNILYGGSITPAKVGTEDEVDDDEKNPDVNYSSEIGSQQLTKVYDGNRGATLGQHNPTVTVTIDEEPFEFGNDISYGTLTYNDRHAGTKTVSAEKAELTGGNFVLTEGLKAQLMSEAFTGVITKRSIHWAAGTLAPKHYDRVADAAEHIVTLPTLVDSIDQAGILQIDRDGLDDERRAIYEGLTLVNGKVTYDDHNVAYDSSGNVTAVPVTATGWKVDGESKLLANYELVEAELKMIFSSPEFSTITGIGGTVNPDAQPKFNALPVGSIVASHLLGGLILPRPVSFDGEIEISKTYDGNAHLVADDIHGDDGSNWQTKEHPDGHHETFTYAHDESHGVKESSVTEGILWKDEGQTVRDDVIHTIAQLVGQQRVERLIDEKVNLTGPGEFFANSSYSNGSKLLGADIGNYELVNMPPITTKIEKATGPRIEMAVTTTANGLTVSPKYYDTHGPAVSLPALNSAEQAASADVKGAAIFSTTGYDNQATSEFTDQHENFTVYQISPVKLTNIQPHSVNPSAWQASPDFANLTPGQTYYVYAQTTSASRNFHEGAISELMVGAENVDAPTSSQTGRKGFLPSTGELTSWLAQGGILATLFALLLGKRKKKDKDED